MRNLSNLYVPESIQSGLVCRRRPSPICVLNRQYASTNELGNGRSYGVANESPSSYRPALREPISCSHSFQVSFWPHSMVCQSDLPDAFQFGRVAWGYSLSPWCTQSRRDVGPEAECLRQTLAEDRVHFPPARFSRRITPKQFAAVKIELMGKFRSIRADNEHSFAAWGNPALRVLHVNQSPTYPISSSSSMTD